MLVAFLLETVASYVTSPLATWMPIAGIATLAVLMILGITYSLSSMLGRTEFRTWVRAKMYDVAFSFLLIFIFFFISTAFIGMNPEPYYYSVNLVPQSPTNCQASTDYYSLSACDMYDFLQSSFQLNSFLYTAVIATSMVPTISVNTAPLFSILAPYGLGLSFDISTSPVAIQSYFGQMIGLLFPLFALNEMQLLLLSAAPLLFATFMALGLIARLFGITRTFGGAMIAFAIGLGILYPLLVSLTYGFIDYGIQANAGPLLSVQEWGGLIFSLIDLLLVVIFNFVWPSGIQYLVGQIVIYGGLVSVGLTLVPFLNFLVVDTFIIDFSKAIGEKMDLLSLLGNLI